MGKDDIISRELAERIVLTQKQYALESMTRYEETGVRTVSIEFMKCVVERNLDIILECIHTFSEDLWQ